MDKTMRISPNYSVSHWESIAFSREEDWQNAIDIFRDRIEGKYIQFIEQIEGDNNSGFVITGFPAGKEAVRIPMDSGRVFRRKPATQVHKSCPALLRSDGAPGTRAAPGRESAE